MGLFSLFGGSAAKPTSPSSGVRVQIFRSGMKASAKGSLHSQHPYSRMLSSIRRRLQLARENQKAQVAKLERYEKSLQEKRADS